MKPIRATGGLAVERGFTLVELLVSLSILGVLSVLLVNSLRLTTRAWDALELRTTATDDEHLALLFLQRQIELAQPLRLSRKPDDKRIGFIGERDGLQFIAPLPGHLGGGGMYWFFLELVSAKDGRNGDAGNEAKRLVLTYQLFQRDEWERFAQPKIEQAVLKDGLTDAQFAYLAPATAERAATWTSDWEAQEQLPRLIRIRLSHRSGANSALQEFFVEPKLAARGGPDA